MNATPLGLILPPAVGTPVMSVSPVSVSPVIVGVNSRLRRMPPGGSVDQPPPSGSDSASGETSFWDESSPSP